MKAHLIDSHAHLTSRACLAEADMLVEAAMAAGVSNIINICTDIESLQEGLSLAKRHPQVVNVGATTPHDVDKEGEQYFAAFATAARQGDLVAVGETGLDYYYEHSDRRCQKDFLRRYLHLAIDCQLPIVIHCREAFDDLFTILDEEYRNQGRWRPGVLHCFTGTEAEAERILSEGWMISFSGIVTYKKSEELRSVAKKTPLSQMLVETDTPYLAPQRWRGQKNQPAYIVETALLLAQLKETPIDEFAQVTSANASLLFKL